ncbi:uncharacterized protein (UPF0303 family) [Sphaerotilus hippei]|uniref:UPF0303 protein C7444_10148 n=1 Tax=Sphaerotilus hippei TaxID=744406 RepID=A0A318HDC6_9BURK|nr:heme-degrading domain-containing protein [Sphaerotilus hippei]PXW99219.1 uncharacterized protein (UPF0303 family) [Sphaerotilus hippei]
MDIEADLQRIAIQEAELVFPHFDADTAWQLGVALREAARARQGAVTIEIRRGEGLLFFHAMPGTTPANADWARRKRHVVELVQRSSYAMSLEGRRDGRDVQQKMGLPERDYACHGGSFPLIVAGAGVIGTITVSGLPQREDHALVVQVLARLLGRDEPALHLD